MTVLLSKMPIAFNVGLLSLKVSHTVKASMLFHPDLFIQRAIRKPYILVYQQLPTVSNDIQ